MFFKKIIKNMFSKKTPKIVSISDSTGKIIDTIKFSEEEFRSIKKSAEYYNMDVNQFFSFLLNFFDAQHQTKSLGVGREINIENFEINIENFENADLYRGIQQ